MTCNHLQQLYQLCQDNQIRLSSSDLVHVVCEQCGKTEVCPSVFTEEYDARHGDEETAAGDAS
jgi:hypothetical protein